MNSRNKMELCFDSKNLGKTLGHFAYLKNLLPESRNRHLNEIKLQNKIETNIHDSDKSILNTKKNE